MREYWDDRVEEDSFDADRFLDGDYTNPEDDPYYVDALRLTGGDMDQYPGQRHFLLTLDMMTVYDFYFSNPIMKRIKYARHWWKYHRGPCTEEEKRSDYRQYLIYRIIWRDRHGRKLDRRSTAVVYPSLSTNS